MADATMMLPVFLPGNNRDWEEIKGVATITEEGEINIKLANKEAGIELVRMARDGVLFAVGFDYLEKARPKETK